MTLSLVSLNYSPLSALCASESLLRAASFACAFLTAHFVCSALLALLEGSALLLSFVLLRSITFLLAHPLLSLKEKG